MHNLAPDLSTAKRTRRARAYSAPRPISQRSARSNDPLAHIDRTTASGRRVADLVGGYLDALDNPSDVTRQAQVVAAAELVVIAEQARSEAIKSSSADFDSIVRLQNLADRAVRRLGIKAGVPPKKKTLARYIATKASRPTPVEVSD